MPDQLPWCACCRVWKMSEHATKVILPSNFRRASLPVWIASGTALQKNHRRSGRLCDYIVHVPERGASYAVLELKSRVDNAVIVVEQLQGGLDLLARSIPPSAAVQAVLVHSRGLGTMEVRSLRRGRLVIRGSRVPIRLERSGAKLMDFM
jgi:hypothetical protein